MYLLNALKVLAVAVLVNAQDAVNTSYLIGSSTGFPTGVNFDGIGAAFTGAAARYLFEYSPGTYNAMLDFLFSPSSADESRYKGAALQILKLEIGSGALTDMGSEPSYAPSGSPDHQNAGWSGRLAQAAYERNPLIKIFLSPQSFPGYLVFTQNPFDNGLAVAEYVAQYVSNFQTLYSVPVSYVGVLSRTPNGNFDPKNDGQQIGYIGTLRDQLNRLNLQSVKIVCADQQQWECAQSLSPNSPTYDKNFADQKLVDVIGNRNVPVAADLQYAIDTNLPVWYTALGAQATLTDGAMSLSNEIFTSYLTGFNSRVSAFIYPVGINAVPYGFPNFHFGLLDATQPWSNHFELTPSLWTIAHFTQFVGPGYTILPNGQGSGPLSNGGYYMTFFNAKSNPQGDFVTVIQKFFAPGDNKACDDENATFTLQGGFGSLASMTKVDVWFTSFSYYIAEKDKNQTHFSHRIGEIPVVSWNDGTNNFINFTVRLNHTGLYTVSYRDASSSPIEPHASCFTRDCYTRSASPAAFGDRVMKFDSGTCFMGSPGTLMVDISGSFECNIYDDPFGDALSMVSDGVPFGPFKSTVPHTLTGDLNMQDSDVSVMMNIQVEKTGMLGVHVSPLNNTAGLPQDKFNLAHGIWLAITPRTTGEVDWVLTNTLEPSAFSIPIAQGSVPSLFITNYVKARLLVRNNKVIGTIEQPFLVEGEGENMRSTLLFVKDLTNIDVPNAGFVGLATGQWEPKQVFFKNLNITALSTSCSEVPKVGSQVKVEMCQQTPGTGFQFVQVDLDPTHDWYSFLPGYDSEDTDSGENMGANVCLGNTTVACYMAACSTNSTTNVTANYCAGFNANGFPKGGFGDVSPTGYTGLYVKNVGAGFLQLTADRSLCIGVNSVPDPKIIELQNCDAGNPLMLWRADLSIWDSGYLAGPIQNVGDGGVLDVYYLGEDVDTQINLYGWHGASNQLFHFDNEMIRITQMGVCMGACRNI
jgi:hypothetical protein